MPFILVSFTFLLSWWKHFSSFPPIYFNFNWAGWLSQFSRLISTTTENIQEHRRTSWPNKCLSQLWEAHCREDIVSFREINLNWSMVGERGKTREKSLEYIGLAKLVANKQLFFCAAGPLAGYLAFIVSTRLGNLKIFRLIGNKGWYDVTEKKKKKKTNPFAPPVTKIGEYVRKFH